MKGIRFINKLNLFKHGLLSELNSPDTFLNHHNFQIPSLYLQENQQKHDKLPAMDDKFDVELSQFEEKCPPGGLESVTLYTTSLRSIRKTFEECQTILFLLQSFKVSFYERDVSMHLEYREELWRTLGGRVIPPCLFIKGRYIGGADEVVTLHEQGKLKKLLEGIPLVLSSSPCGGCGNKRFVVCFHCGGSRKVFVDRESCDEMFIRCQECNENGLVKCSICI
ncbi:uncharacterized protein At5g39865 [Mercurialis annua]|uniref:uncharacterized protein At5g39865 n=1 Tax=Mercurialis annua TaxID=3986 RepID=UPI002160590B|nr:uncharacterized protein At5g39865 [Mercurialis annua]